MSFLNPLAWLGIVAAAVPIWLHLRERPPRNVVLFSALRFLEGEPRPRPQPQKLRDPLLLALRVLALLLVVGGLAWPYLRGRSAIPVTESRVHVLDNTLSQQAGGGLERSRALLLEALASTGPETQHAVIEITAQARVVGGFGEPREALGRQVESLPPRFERGSYLEAFRLAATLLASSLGERKRILLYGDGQENQWSDHENAPPFLQGLEVEVVEAPRFPARPNLSLGDPAVQRVFAGDRALVELSARLAHQGPARSARVRLTANGKEIVAKAVDLGPSGGVTLRAQWESDPGQPVLGEVVVAGAPDDLPADDRVFFALPPVEEGRVALLARSTYLEAALSPEVMRGRWSVRAVEPWRSEGAEEPLLDVLVAEGSYLQSQRVRDLVLKYLTNGRGVMLLIERETPVVEGFLRHLGFEPMPPRAAPAPAVAFRYLAADHPVFRPFLSPDFGRLGDVRVSSFVPMKAPGGLPLLFGDSGHGLVFEGTRTKGRLLVFAFPFERSHTNWPVDPTFVPFLDLCLQHAREAGAIETSLRPGERHVFDLPRDARVRQVVLRSGAEVVGRAPVEAEGRVPLEVPRQPGLYLLGYDEDPAPRRVFAVNPSPKESALRYVGDPPALRAWRIPDPAPEDAPAAAAAPALAHPRGALDQKLWWWLLVLGAGLLAAETSWLLARKEAS